MLPVRVVNLIFGQRWIKIGSNISINLELHAPKLDRGIGLSPVHNTEEDKVHEFV